MGRDSQMVESLGDFSLVPCSKQPELRGSCELKKMGSVKKQNRPLSEHKESSRAGHSSFLVKVSSSRCWGKELRLFPPKMPSGVLSDSL